MRNLITTIIGHVIIVIVLIGLYMVVANLITKAEADTQKFGEGPYVMAISYTDYKNLQYVGNFTTCVIAEAYFHANCAAASIMMCQLETHMYMPLNHDSNYEFSSFDFEIDTKQSCGFVGVQQPKFTKD